MTAPTVGRTVHYVSYGTPGGEYGKHCRTAFVTEVADDAAEGNDTIGLAVLNPTGLFFHSLADGGCAHHEALPDGEHEPAQHAANHPGGTWHWPERAT